MGAGGARVHVPLTGLTREQVETIRSFATGWLITKAADLTAHGARGKEIEEVAALGRLVADLGRDQVDVSDPMIRELVARETSETRLLDELTEEYRRELAEHEAWVALLARLDAGAGSGDA